MKIVAVRDAVVPIRSEIRNAYIDFSQMTASVVAVVTDVVRHGRPVVGFGFNSNDRRSSLLNHVGIRGANAINHNRCWRRCGRLHVRHVLAAGQPACTASRADRCNT